MVDYTKPTGSAGQLIIRDDGTNVSFWLSCSDGATNIGAPGASWSGVINGVTRSGQFTWPSGGGTRRIGGPWAVSSSQTASFGIGATGTTGLGGPSSHSAAITRALPAAPSALTVTRVSDTQHTLNWSRNATYSSVVVQRRTDGGAWQQVGAPSGNAFTFTDTTTTGDRKYEYRVAGKTAAGQSTWSGITTVYTTPAAPTGITAARSGNDIVVAAAGVPRYATSYDVMDGAAVVATGVSLPFTHTAPSPSAPHTYTVRGKVGTLAGAYSAPSNTVQLLAPPNAATGLTPNGAVRAGDDVVRVAWTHNPVDSSVQTAYELRYRSVGTSTWTTLSGTAAAFRDLTLTVGPWEWQVRTKGSHADFSPWSATATVTVIDRPGVAVIQPDTSWDRSALTVVWSWFQAQSRPQSAWEIELSNGTGDTVEVRSGSGAATTVTLGHRLTEGSWTVRVRAATGDVWSVWAVEAFTVSFIPPAPALLNALWDESEGGVTLSVASGDPDAPVADLTNVFTNPSFEGQAGTVDLYRNLIRDPDMVNLSMWTATAGVLSQGTGNRLVATSNGNSTVRLGAMQQVDAKYPAGTYTMSVDMEGADASLTTARIILLDTNGSIIRATTSMPKKSASKDRYDFTLTATGDWDRLYLELIGTGIPTGAVAAFGRPIIGLRSIPVPFFSAGQGVPSPDLVAVWAGAANASNSILRGTRPAGINTSVSNAYLYQSTEWASTGGRSVKVEPNGGGNASYGSLLLEGLTPFQTYTVVARLRLREAQTGALHATWVRQLMVQSSDMPVNNVLSNRTPNEAGVHEMRVTFTLGASTRATVFLMNGSISTPIWVDDVVAVAGVYAGGYFDGDTEAVRIGDVVRRPVWNGPPHASTSSTVAFPATVGVRLDRSIDDGETWELVADLTNTATLIDWESLSYGDTLYRATASTSEGATSEVVVIAPSRSDALWLSGGPGFGVAGRLPFDPVVKVSAGRERALKQYAGRRLPVALSGEALSRTISVSGRTTDRDDETADVEQLTRIAQLEDTTFLFRDPDGRRVYGSIGEIQMSRESSTFHPDGWEGLWGYSFTMTETESR
ncbi:fibronectin type III domain-containing protein [Microbacterium sp. K36]|uniref:fibronectin type III domain-containing protein n=1 Tax=Microbacterium sp. K36 TaxID=2305439 RepID=UPI00109C0C62|nr:fibronectin type III domain-containing protein [Microbacterium sp. K36]